MLQWIQNIDNQVVFFIQANWHRPILDGIMPFISRIGDLGMIWIAIAVILFFIPKYKKYGVMVVLGVLLAALSGELILKHLVERVRPCNLYPWVSMLIPRPQDFSFPSGHTSASFAAMTVIWRANKKFGIAAFLLALLIASSRLYLFVHYPTDILAGAVLGFLCGVTAIKIYDKIPPRLRAAVCKFK